MQTEQATLSNKKRVTSVIAASSGNLVEWFDFYIYAFGATYFTHHFAASDDPTIGLIQTLGIFALGFFMRPIGSYIFGSLADKIGRKHSMVISVLLMALGSFAIAVLPTKDSIGDWAIVLLLLARLLQGLSVGGEYGIAATYLSELGVNGRRGFYSSFQYVTLIGGQLLAVASVTFLQAYLGKEALGDYGWRILFALGGLLGLLSLLVRANMHESGTEGLKHKDRGTFKALLQYKSNFVKLVFFTAGGSLCFYTFTVYSKIYMINTAHLDSQVTNYVMLSALFFFMIFQPIWGAIADKIGRKKSLLIFGVLSLVSVYPAFSMLGKVSSSLEAFFIVLYLLIILTPYTSIAGVAKAELFPVHIRALGTGLSYAIANAIFGGSASYVALKFKSAGMESFFFAYVMIILAILIITVMTFPKKTYLD